MTEQKPVIEEGKVPAVVVGLDDIMYLSNISLEDAQKSLVELDGKKFITFLIENTGEQGTRPFVFPVLVETNSVFEQKPTEPVVTEQTEVVNAESNLDVSAS